MSAPAGFYSPPQMQAIVSRWDAVWHLQDLVQPSNVKGGAFNRTPQPLVNYDLPAIATVSWAEWWAIAGKLTQDADAAHQLALYATTAVTGGASVQYQTKALTFLQAWASTCLTVGAGDSPLSFAECVPGLIFADILCASVQWAGRQQFENWIRSLYLPTCQGIVARPNNWGAWGSFGVLLAQRHLGISMDAATATLEKQITAMIDPNGQLQQEMLRIGSQLWYSYYCLVPLTCACRVVKNAGGPDLFTTAPYGTLLVAAVDNLLAMMANPTAVTGKPPYTASQPWPYDLLAAMAEEYNDSAWRTAAANFAASESNATDVFQTGVISYWNHHTGWNLPTLTALAGL